ncbi:ribonuclease [Eubacteriales bacterium OttesenSCG-928-N13]|nr:ribonuclease [Eubacteriales bacterium OttesenSCG-928-N13]
MKMKKLSPGAGLILLVVLLALYWYSTGGINGAPQQQVQRVAPNQVEQAVAPDSVTAIDEDGEYNDKDNVALYIHTYGKLPKNFVTKKQAEEAGWDAQSGNLNDVLPGCSIGGDHFGNHEGLLPEAQGRRYTECDIDYTHGHRGGKRIVFSSDGMVFYSANHYKDFEQLY